MKDNNKNAAVDKMGLFFGKAMVIFTIAGIIVMVVPAIAYFLGYKQFIPHDEVVRYWANPVAKFWMLTKGAPVHGYGWIFDNLGYSDSVSMIGVMLLLVTPLFAMIAAAIKASGGIFRFLFFVSAIEFIVSVVFKMN